MLELHENIYSEPRNSTQLQMHVYRFKQIITQRSASSISVACHPLFYA